MRWIWMLSLLFVISRLSQAAGSQQSEIFPSFLHDAVNKQAQSNFRIWEGFLYNNSKDKAIEVYAAHLKCCPSDFRQSLIHTDILMNLLLVSHSGNAIQSKIQVFGIDSYFHFGEYLINFPAKQFVKVRFTYLWSNLNSGWQIVHHHTSIQDEKHSDLRVNTSETSDSSSRAENDDSTFLYPKINPESNQTDIDGAIANDTEEYDNISDTTNVTVDENATVESVHSEFFSNPYTANVSINGNATVDNVDSVSSEHQEDDKDIVAIANLDEGFWVPRHATSVAMLLLHLIIIMRKRPQKSLQIGVAMLFTLLMAAAAILFLEPQLKQHYSAVMDWLPHVTVEIFSSYYVHLLRPFLDSNANRKFSRFSSFQVFVIILGIVGINVVSDSTESKELKDLYADFTVSFAMVTIFTATIRMSRSFRWFPFLLGGFCALQMVLSAANNLAEHRQTMTYGGTLQAAGLSVTALVFFFIQQLTFNAVYFAMACLGSLATLQMSVAAFSMIASAEELVKYFDVTIIITSSLHILLLLVLTVGPRLRVIISFILPASLVCVVWYFLIYGVEGLGLVQKFMAYSERKLAGSLLFILLPCLNFCILNLISLPKWTKTDLGKLEARRSSVTEVRKSSITTFEIQSPLRAYKKEFAPSKEDYTICPTPPQESLADVLFELRLEMNMEEIKDFKAFEKEITFDIARAAEIEPSKISVSSIRAGSIILDLALCGDCKDARGHTSREVIQNLEEQAKDPFSKLFQGKYTSRTYLLCRHGNSKTELQNATVISREISPVKCLTLGDSPALGPHRDTDNGSRNRMSWSQTPSPEERWRNELDERIRQEVASRLGRGERISPNTTRPQTRLDDEWKARREAAERARKAAELAAQEIAAEESLRLEVKEKRRSGSTPKQRSPEATSKEEREKLARLEAEEEIWRIAALKARKEKESALQRAEQERAVHQPATQTRNESVEHSKRAAEIAAHKMAEEKLRAAEEEENRRKFALKARKDAELAAHAASEERLRLQAEEEIRRQAAVKARKEVEIALQRVAEEQARREAENLQRIDAISKARISPDLAAKEYAISEAQMKLAANQQIRNSKANQNDSSISLFRNNIGSTRTEGELSIEKGNGSAQSIKDTGLEDLMNPLARFLPPSKPSLKLEGRERNFPEEERKSPTIAAVEKAQEMHQRRLTLERARNDALQAAKKVADDAAIKVSELQMKRTAFLSSSPMREMEKQRSPTSQLRQDERASEATSILPRLQSHIGNGLSGNSVDVLTADEQAELEAQNAAKNATSWQRKAKLFGSPGGQSVAEASPDRWQQIPGSGTLLGPTSTR